MNEVMYKRILYRRKFLVRIFILILTVTFSLVVSSLLFGNLEVPLISKLTELENCPACYGVSMCPELYSNMISLEKSKSAYPWSELFNAKNIYYGYSKSRGKGVVIKKLAHDSEFRDFDSKLCGIWNLKPGCKPRDLSNAFNIREKIIELVHYNISWPEVQPRKGIVMCPYPQSIFNIIDPILLGEKSVQNISKFDLLTAWTTLYINPEPIILQTLKKSEGWRVPSYLGVCGRLEIVTDDGLSLASLTKAPFKTKLSFAKQIIDASMDFTFKHDKYRFYLMDWSIDNIVANAKGEISFVDLEDVIILDKEIMPNKYLPNWYQRYFKDFVSPGFTFSIEDICKHHFSDHNFWAACYLLAGNDNPYLLPIPKNVNDTMPQLHFLLRDCLNHYSHRLRIVTQLQELINEMLEKGIY